MTRVAGGLRRREALRLAESFKPEVAAGFDHHFVKPLDPAGFERILAQRGEAAF